MEGERDRRTKRLRGGGVKVRGSEWAADSVRHLLGASVVGGGFIAYWLALWLTRQRREGSLVADERDAQIIARANQVSLVVVLVGIFASAIGLWTAYEDVGQVPVGWLWFLAYWSVILAFLSGSVATLLVDGGMRKNG